MSSVEMAYRKTAAASAGGMGILIALYDTLAGDLRRAADAERRNDIEQRCREARHALLVIAHLEDRISRGSGGELAERLKLLYASLRRKIVEAQAKHSAVTFEQQMAVVLKLREQWQRMEEKQASAGPQILPPVTAQRHIFPGDAERKTLSWSA